MESARWKLQRHCIPAAHTRGTSRGLRPGHGALRLALKHYTRLDGEPWRPGAITLVVAHGIGGNKESFEPWFDELAHAGACIRTIWTVDAVHNGESYLLNEGCLGDDLDWLDYSRDLFHAINYFQEEMPQPLVGIGHSLGAGAIAYLGAWHPRLFSGIVMLEPGMGPGSSHNWPPPLNLYPGLLAMRRVCTWPTREEATKDLRKSRLYRNYDPRAFDKILRYELRKLNPRDDKFGVWENGVTLITPNEVEVGMWIVPDPPLPGFSRRQDLDNPATETTIMPGIRRPESYRMRDALTKLCCPVLYVWASKSPLNHPRRQKIYLQDTALEWSGRNENIATHTIESGHMVAQENPISTATAVSGWLESLYKREQEKASEATLEPPFVRGVHPAMLERFSNL